MRGAPFNFFLVSPAAVKNFPCSGVDAGFVSVVASFVAVAPTVLRRGFHYNVLGFYSSVLPLLWFEVFGDPVLPGVLFVDSLS